jgi:Ca2+-binding EF-hand superfamily protein
MKMLHCLVKNKNIHLKEVRRILKIEYELSDEIIQKYIDQIDQLSNPDVTLEELTKTLVDMKTECPFPKRYYSTKKRLTTFVPQTCQR